MVTHYDEKGKFFTQKISKRPVNVVVQAGSQRLEGTIHVRPDERVIDELNDIHQFIAVTDVTVFSNDGSEVMKSRFLILNKDQIVWILPSDEIIADKD